MSHPDLDALLNILLSFAQQRLSKHGPFYPFGASLKQDGTASLAEGYSGNDNPDSSDLISLLESGFRREATEGQIKAVGICADIRITPPGRSEKIDAVRATLEHVTGEAVEVYLPYHKGVFGKVKYGELFASKGTPRIFSESNSR